MKYNLIVIGYREGERVGEIRDYKSEVWADKWLEEITNGYSPNNNSPIAVKYKIKKGFIEPQKVLAIDGEVSKKDSEMIYKLKSKSDVEVEYI